MEEKEVRTRHAPTISADTEDQSPLLIPVANSGEAKSLRCGRWGRQRPASHLDSVNGVPGGGYPLVVVDMETALFFTARLLIMVRSLASARGKLRVNILRR